MRGFGSMVELPDGTVTLLFTDVARSTELVKKLQESYEHELAIHRGLLRSVFAEHGGVVVDTQGDAFFVAFDRARLAVEAAAAAQRALGNHAWPDDVSRDVRIGMHTGEPFRSGDGYTGLAVHRAARICTMGHGGQVLLSGATAGVVDDVEIAGVALRDLGDYPLKDFDRPERLFQLIISGLACFPAP
jgi:class 3 adenylate cyclase